MATTAPTAFATKPWLCYLGRLRNVGSRTIAKSDGTFHIVENEQGGFGQRNHSIFGSLTTVDVGHHSLGVDIGDLEIEGT